MTPRQLPQQAIDHWRQPHQTHLPGQLNSRVDRRRGRNARTEQQLIGTQLQNPAQLGRLARR